MTPEQLLDRRHLAAIPDDSRDRLIRLEEGVKHIDKTLQEIRHELSQQNASHSKRVQELEGRIEATEKRVDNIYFFKNLVSFIGVPTTLFILYQVMHKFGQ